MRNRLADSVLKFFTTEGTGSHRVNLRTICFSHRDEYNSTFHVTTF
jgi:hypothetical protein